MRWMCPKGAKQTPWEQRREDQNNKNSVIRTTWLVGLVGLVGDLVDTTDGEVHWSVGH